MQIANGDKRIAIYPSDHFKVSYTISFDHPLLRHQSRTERITEQSFAESIAPARTFGFLKEVELLRQNGLALGGSLENAIVIGDAGVLTRCGSKTSSSATRFSTRRRSRARRPPDRRSRRRAPRRPRASHRAGVPAAGRAGRLDVVESPAVAQMLPTAVPATARPTSPSPSHDLLKLMAAPPRGHLFVPYNPLVTAARAYSRAGSRRRTAGTYRRADPRCAVHRAAADVDPRVRGPHIPAL